MTAHAMPRPARQADGIKKRLRLLPYSPPQAGEMAAIDGRLAGAPASAPRHSRRRECHAQAAEATKAAASRLPARWQIIPRFRQRAGRRRRSRSAAPGRHVAHLRRGEVARRDDARHGAASPASFGHDARQAHAIGQDAEIRRLLRRGRLSRHRPPPFSIGFALQPAIRARAHTRFAFRRRRRRHADILICRLPTSVVAGHARPSDDTSIATMPQAGARRGAPCCHDIVADGPREALLLGRCRQTGGRGEAAAFRLTPPHAGSGDFRRRDGGWADAHASAAARKRLITLSPGAITPARATASTAIAAGGRLPPR